MTGQTFNDLNESRRKKLQEAMKAIGVFYPLLAMQGVRIDWDKVDALIAEKAKALMAHDESDPSTEDTGDVTVEKPKPVANPFYPKGSW